MSFQIIPRAIDPDILTDIANQFREIHKNPNNRTRGQSGIGLSDYPDVIEKLSPLRLIASEIARRNVSLTSGCSCRWQPPSGQGSLALHQDAGVMGDTTDTKHLVVMWIPLVPIDEQTPGLEFSPVKTKPLAHIPDQAGYLVLKSPNQASNVPLVSLTHLEVGDIVILGPDTLHRSYVKPWHTKDRLSLDLRYLAPPRLSHRMRVFSRKALSVVRHLTAHRTKAAIANP